VTNVGTVVHKHETILNDLRAALLDGGLAPCDVTTFMDESEMPVFVQEEIADSSRHRWRFRVTL